MDMRTTEVNEVYRENKTEIRRGGHQRPSGGRDAAPRLTARPRVVRVPGGFAFVEDGPVAHPGHVANDGGVAMR